MKSLLATSHSLLAKSLFALLLLLAIGVLTMCSSDEIKLLPETWDGYVKQFESSSSETPIFPFSSSSEPEIGNPESSSSSEPIGDPESSSSSEPIDDPESSSSSEPIDDPESSSSNMPGSSSSIEQSSSSETTLTSSGSYCKLPNGTCIAVNASTCTFMNGTSYNSSSCDNSPVIGSSSSLPPSSSSLLPSSSSVMPSSSSSRPSSSSFLSSSSASLCANFIEGVTRRHYEKDKNQFCDERDGKEYVYVEIEDLNWMAENLNYAPLNGNSKCSEEDVHDEYYCSIYGRLYDWETAMNACPAGWRLPTREEWDLLAGYIEVEQDCENCDALYLKARVGWSNGGGLDTYGFTAFPGGFGSPSGDDDMGFLGGWWSAESNYYRYIINSDFTYSGYNDTSRLFSVRCVKDE